MSDEHKIVIGIDPGRVTGICIIEWNGETYQTLYRGVIDTAKLGIFHSEVEKVIYYVSTQFDTHRKIVASERIFPVGMQSIIDVAKRSGIVQAIAEQCDFRYEELMPAAVRGTLTGGTTKVSKAQMKEVVRHYLDWPVRVKRGEKTITQHEYDAAAVALTWMSHYGIDLERGKHESSARE